MCIATLWRSLATHYILVQSGHSKLKHLRHNTGLFTRLVIFVAKLNHKQIICGLWPPQFVVAKGHIIFVPMHVIGLPDWTQKQHYHSFSRYCFHKTNFCVQKQSQFVVTEDYNILEVTERLFGGIGRHSFLYSKH